VIADGSEREFAWDHRNRLVAVTDKSAGGTVLAETTFAYDAQNRRIAKTAAGATTWFVYDREDVLLDFNDPDAGGPTTPTVAVRYLHGAGIDMVLAEDRGGGSALAAGRSPGTTRDVIDGVGAVVNHLPSTRTGTSSPRRTRWRTPVSVHGTRARYRNRVVPLPSRGTTMPRRVAVSEDLVKGTRRVR
jgi:YD repeat-containing protein